jgi:tetratricopeptide (TPR) repeat protein
MREPEGRIRRSPIDIATRLASALAGRYTIDREIGRGGMATVYLAHDVRHDRRVAVKVLVDSVTSAVGSERFLREIHIASALTHPHILTVHDSGEADGLLYCVMPFVDGESLRARMVRERQLPIEDSIQITREIADALAYAHAHGVVHRDIKPENILLSGGHALVCDFGIARALTGTGVGERRLTDSGTSVGTPLYMSPEQAAGDSDIDGRADLYALGCVCFEMLTGMPPFTGVNAQVVRMRHVAEPPPPIRTMRPTVPREIEEVVHRLMAKVPADRFPTAARLRDTLSTPTSEGSAVARARRRWWQLGALVGILALVLGIVLGGRGIGSFTSLGGIEPDSSRYAVLPLMELIDDGPLPADLSGARVARNMADALGDWRGIEVVRDFRVRDLLNRAGQAPRTMQASAGLARQLRAGVVIWGDVRAASGGADVRAVMYLSTDPDSLIAQHNVFVPAGGALRDSMVALTAGLLTDHGGTTRRPPGTSDLNAHNAFVRGQDALSDWDMTRALAQFERAVQIDPGYAEAHLWLALVQTWAGDDNPRSEAWRVSARRAAELAEELPVHERPYAVALGAIADRRFDLACSTFDNLVRADSTSFEAWFGLANCLVNDRTVVRDGRSPSGYSFRTSWERAITAYMNAFELVPSMHRAFRGAAFDRLPHQMLFATPNRARPGIFMQGDDTVRFHAFAALQNDTIAFTPYPSSQLFSGQAGPTAQAIAGAAARNRERLRKVTERWVDAFPSSSDAREAFAKALEGLGELALSRDERHSALAQLGHARRLATHEDQRLRLAEADIRLLLKTESFARAAQLADSVLAHAPDTITDVPTLSGLAALAALRGDAAGAAALLRRTAPRYAFTTPGGNQWTIDRPVAEPALSYLAYAAVGAPADTLRALERATRTALEQFASGERREELAIATLLRPSMLAFPITGATWIHQQDSQPTPLFTLQRMLLAGDTVALRRQLDEYVTERAALRPGDVSIDHIYQEAELRLAIGDTIEATRLLDRSLSGLPTLGFDLVHHVAEPAALVGAMALRAALASRAGERRIADRWGAAVAALRAPAKR